MGITLQDPRTHARLEHRPDGLYKGDECVFPFVNGAFRCVEGANYSDTFGWQWNRFDRTQLDSHSGINVSEDRLFAETGWSREDLEGSNVLEVGSGAGRFSEVLLKAGANVYSVDFSDAVSANARSNEEDSERLHLFQASIYEMPFAPRSFDRVLCLGVLQHTPDFRASVRALYEQVAPGGELVIDFYPINGWWTKINGKYIVRPLTRRLPPKLLFKCIEVAAPPLSSAADALAARRLSAISRFIPVATRAGLPDGLNGEQLREWVVLDTYDMLSPAHDHPQRLKTVARWLVEDGAQLELCGEVYYGHGLSATVVRARRPAHS